MRNALLALGFLILALAVASPGTALAGRGKKGQEETQKAKVKVSPDGTWKVKLTPDAASLAKGGQEFEDTLILRKGKFRSTAGEAEGFGEGPCRVDGSHWLSDVVSKAGGSRHWHGELNADQVEGEMTWTRADGAVLNYTFTGNRTGEPSRTPPDPKPGQ